MVSPHPSYPPLEMAYYGLQVITNRFCCKDLTTRSKNFICVDNCTPSEVADALELAIKRSDDFKPSKGQILPIHCGGEVFSIKKLLEIW